ncbi:MAG: 1,4-alpha-glucan branching protein domain-containing protein [Candidatus Hydrogenedentales bacterium]
MKKPCLALVLNAHLPFVRKPEIDPFFEERWLFEAISETYLPLLRLFRKLETENVPFKLSIAISPTLLAMLSDKILCDRYSRYLDLQLELAAQEKKRLSGDSVFAPIAQLYHTLYKRNKDDFENLYLKNILTAFDYFYKKGKIEVLTSGATHAFLPLFQDAPQAIHAQVETAIVTHRSVFGKNPQGFWLPQFGWYPGLDELLHDYNIKYTIVTTRGALLGHPTPFYGSFSPVTSPSGLTVFIRDAGATKAVWSETEGYPADPVYRDFYRDIGYDLDTSYVGPFLGEGIDHGVTGFKYWAVTGHTDQKRPYEPGAAAAKVIEHAHAFLAERKAAARAASFWMKDRQPLIVCPYDAELFGHWWFEGPQFLEALFKTAARKRGDDDLEFVTLSEYDRNFPENPVSEPEFSSWGEGGYAEVWLDGSNDWVHRHSHKAIERMMELAERFPNESGLRERILNQGAREALLTMASDWPLLLRSGQSSSFAKGQIEESVGNFTRIYEMLCANTVDTEWLTTLEKKNNLFPEINYRVFAQKR